jgi:nicotinamide-nucleotide amidase
VILSIGDELVLGQTVDSNSAHLSARLAEIGIPTVYHQTVPDDEEAIGRALRVAAREATLVLVTGGLGPTPDDLTRQALAAFLRVPLELHPPSLTLVEDFFRRIGRAMPAANRVQAMCPRGAVMLDNECGTAPGIRARKDDVDIVAMPGVTREMKAMFERHVAPGLAAGAGRVILTRAVHTFGMGESAVAEQLGSLMDRRRNPLVGTTVSGGVVSVRIRSEFPVRSQAQSELDRTAEEVIRILAPAVFGVDHVTLPEAVGALLREKRQTVVTAESCTGGLVAKMLTDVPGSSDYFLGGWVVYGNDLKTGELDVPAAIIASAGAVSEPVARIMAERALVKGKADFALATTGIAGPNGGSADKPVGTVWIGFARRPGGDIQSRAERFQFRGVRETIRERTAKAALNVLRLELLAPR